MKIGINYWYMWPTLNVGHMYVTRDKLQTVEINLHMAKIAYIAAFNQLWLEFIMKHR